MPGTIHPNPNEVVRIAASKELPKRVSIPGGKAKAKVFFGASVADSSKEVELNDDNRSVDVAQPVLVLTDANTIVTEGLAAISNFDGTASENFETDVKVVEAKPSDDEKDVAERNENASIPSLSGDADPEPKDDQKATESKDKVKSQSKSSK